MINEKWISEMEQGLGCLVPKKGSDEVVTCHEYSIQGLICDCELQRLLSLARLGLEFKSLMNRHGGKDRLIGCVTLGEYAGEIIRGDLKILPAFKIPDALPKESV